MTFDAMMKEENDGEYTIQDAKEFIYKQKIRARKHEWVPLEVSTFRDFIWDRDLKGASQKDLFEMLCDELGLDREMEPALIKKVKVSLLISRDWYALQHA